MGRPALALTAAALFVGAATGAVSGAVKYEQPARVCAISDPAVTESSGVAASSTDGEVLYTHNDSGGDAVLYAVRRADCATVARLHLRDATNFDWEDLARGVRDGRPTLVVGDIGDNLRIRPGVRLYEVAEPDLDAEATAPADLQLDVTERVLRYADGRHDAEALLIHPRRDEVVVVTKEDPAGVYVATPGAEVLERVATIEGVGLITGGDIAPGGDRLVVRTQRFAVEWPIVDGDWVATFAGERTTMRLPDVAQGEAIGYDRLGEALVLTSEGHPAPIDELVGDAAPQPIIPTTVAPAPAPPTPETSDGGIVRGAVAGFAAGVVVLVVLARRRSRGNRSDGAGRPS